MSRIEQAVILCGGLGTRLRPYTDNMPKPMALCNGKPFLWYLLEQLHEQKIGRFLLLTGYMANKIEEFFGDGSTWGWEIEYSKGLVDWDTGRRVWNAKEEIDDIFLLLYSDNFSAFSLDKVIALHNKNHKPLTLMVSSKNPGNIALDKKSIVKKYDNNRSDKNLNYVEIGYMVVEKDRVLSFYDKPDCSFSSILHKIASQKKISAWVQNDQYYSISDLERWKKTEEYLKSKKIILIDRDGIINKKAPKGKYIAKWEEFEWISESRDTMKILAKDGFKFIVITNQAGIARNMIKSNELERIHYNMTQELKRDGVEILNIYVCPHHWDEGCSCRKPNPGMLFQSSNDYLFRLDKILFIGDDPRDCQAAEKSGCNSIFIGEVEKLKGLTESERPIYASTYLRDATNAIYEYYA
jgi:D-glycero-D-manno-heptose 1,7-bisphosphate phosphatase